MREFDAVRSVSAIDEKIGAGCSGTILDVLDRDVFLVEFMDGDESLGTPMVRASQIVLIEPYTRSPSLAAE